jgi:protein O-GlcNAcase / histone acetyltransferase
MSEQRPQRFLSGVVEGFYGQPWTHDERLGLFRRLADLGLNTYFYAPKDDLKHRALWREPYSDEEAARLRELIAVCRACELVFVYGLSPGLDIRYADDADAVRLQRRLEQMIELGCGDFALLFDDIPDAFDGTDGSLAAAQSRVTNGVFTWLRERRPAARLAFCPTAYCSRMVDAGVGGSAYLETIGSGLLPGIDVLWTGPEIVSGEITVEHVQDVRATLKRKPVIWDNLHANDYDGRRFFCGPYSGRSSALTAETAGILINPNTEAALDDVPLRTFAEYLAGPDTYDPRRAYLAAMAEWLRSFRLARGTVSLDDLVLLGDCFYLPYEEGGEAREMLDHLHAAIGASGRTASAAATVARQRLGRLREITARLTELHDRPLFHALSRRLWDLREEVDLLDRYLAHRLAPAGGDRPFRSDFHRPGTYRGGMIAKLQSVLTQRPDGTFAAADPPDTHERAATGGRC